MKAGNKPYDTKSELAEVIPVFPLSGALLLPGGQLPLNIFEPRYLKMVDDALSGEKLIGMIQPCLKGSKVDGDTPKLSSMGCVGRLTAFQETGDGRYLINLAGVCRYQVVEEIDGDTPYRKCRIKAIESDLNEYKEGAKVDRDAILEAFRKYLTANNIDADWETVDRTDNVTLVNALCMMSPFDAAEKQALLETSNIGERAEKLIAISEFNLAAKTDDGSHKLN